ncbi:alpha-glucosidase [Nocardioides mangrovi]|uniref:Alpha-glucosidase n=1 Tax=Nocardioides mangrovi TaxID=2874580 RepID=A0ABS7UKJ8_9ACTN|nr:alpha-glucosidase [Nocardioides mangrovi]MBZ5741117.1 alpha-glucosidase [Nocardioides mangrovi]
MPARGLPLLPVSLAVAVGLALLPSAADAQRADAFPVDHTDIVAPGTLTVADAAGGTWHAGDLTVTITADAGLAVTTDAGRTVWASPAGQAFVTGGRGTVAWEESRGYFWPTVTYADRLGDQSVDAVTQDGDTVVVTGGLVGESSTEGATYTLTIGPRRAHGASLDLTTDAATPLTSVGLVSGRSDHAAVHGLGEQFTDFDLDGRLLPIVDREQGVGRGEQPITGAADSTNYGAGGTEDMTYAAWPSFLTEDLRGLRLAADAPGSSAFAMADTRDPDAVDLELWSPTMSAQASAAGSPVGLVRAQQAGDTRPALAPWATKGAIIGLQGGTDEVRSELRTLQKAGTKISGVWLQDWTGQRVTSFGSRLWWTWQLDRSRYPGWAGLVSGLRKQGIRVTTYVNPFLVDAAPKGDDSIRNLWAEADAAGYLVRDPDGGPYLLDQGGFDASLVDLTNPQAQEWFAHVIADEVLAHGVSGFMADFAEGLPFDAVLAHGDAADLHNRWPTLWAQTVREGCLLAGKPGCVTWLRSGGLGQAASSPMFWNGDQLVDFSRQDGLASVLLGTFSAGVSGWPLTHSDIGGYTSVQVLAQRSADLLPRWAELQAFGTMMRTHEGNRPAENAQVFSSAASAKTFARMTRLYAALTPYRRTVVDEATRTGVPAVRQGWLVVPGTRAADAETQFFLGAHVLVAPVLSQGATSVRVTFPPGKWEHLLTGKVYAGNRTATVTAPIGTPAAFVKVGDPWAKRLRHRIEAAGL